MAADSPGGCWRSFKREPLAKSACWPDFALQAPLRSLLRDAHHRFWSFIDLSRTLSPARITCRHHRRGGRSYLWRHHAPPSQTSSADGAAHRRRRPILVMNSRKRPHALLDVQERLQPRGGDRAQIAQAAYGVALVKAGMGSAHASRSSLASERYASSAYSSCLLRPQHDAFCVIFVAVDGHTAASRCEDRPRLNERGTIRCRNNYSALSAITLRRTEHHLPLREKPTTASWLCVFRHDAPTRSRPVRLAELFQPSRKYRRFGWARWSQAHSASSRGGPDASKIGKKWGRER